MKVDATCKSMSCKPRPVTAGPAIFSSSVPGAVESDIVQAVVTTTVGVDAAGHASVEGSVDLVVVKITEGDNQSR